jgi:hypothetical protein
MRDIRPTLFIDGCSRLANSSQDRNKIIRKFCAIWAAKTAIVVETMFENSQFLGKWRKRSLCSTLAARPTAHGSRQLLLT